MKLFARLSLIPGIFLLLILTSGCGSTQNVQTTSSPSNVYEGVLLDTVKAQRFDTGKMWTFDFPPLDYFEQTYNFRPTQEWLDDVRMSAVKFGTWCSGSFVSEDGLIMTNNHCSDFLLQQLQKQGEDLLATGFYAETLEDERKHPTLHVDQLISIQDVTDEIQSAINKGTTDEEKTKFKAEKIKALQEQNSAKTGLVYNVVTLYNGGKYSLYGYKRYKDIRLVLIPESALGLYGGDPDNYTYPRYSLDCTFWRAYDEDGKPVKVKNYFKWSPNGAQEDEPIFVIGNPGNTNKLKSVAQLEYMRDYTYRVNAFLMQQYQKNYEELIAEFPEKRSQYIGTLNNIANSNKRFTGVLRGLRNPIYMARKKDFEKTLREKVMSDPKLAAKYSTVWENLAMNRQELSQYANEYSTLSRNSNVYSAYYKIADELIKLAGELKLPEEQRGSKYKTDSLAVTIENIFPANFDEALQRKVLRAQANLMMMLLGKDNEHVQKLFGGKEGDDAVKHILSLAKIKTRNEVIALANKGSDAILSSDDPFIYFNLKNNERYTQLQGIIKEINTTETVFENQLGQALFEVFGTTIPPDGSFSLRIGDGVLKSYDYNGTVAPVVTTFYGLYDRYYSHKKKYPWDLPERWKNPSEDFDMSTPYNFISTHDIVGGSSGSAVINKNKEVVGLAFDGNIEGNSGYFIYDTVENRMISVASQGMLEVIQDMFKTKRIADELKHSKILK
ncbi:MAG: S46 family peptidase [Ignavibacteriales bacterium]|nr:MAG: S46 family peptidase [Ignavibacteriales bacterium]